MCVYSCYITDLRHLWPIFIFYILCSTFHRLLGSIKLTHLMATFDFIWLILSLIWAHNSPIETRLHNPLLLIDLHRHIWHFSLHIPLQCFLANMTWLRILWLTHCLQWQICRFLCLTYSLNVSYTPNRTRLRILQLNKCLHGTTVTFRCSHTLFHSLSHHKFYDSNTIVWHDSAFYHCSWLYMAH